MTSRELVIQTLEHKNHGGRAPRQLWVLPWAEWNHPQMHETITNDFPSDFGGPQVHYLETPKTEGDPYRVGEYTDEWGCRFRNLQEGVIGEVKEPIIPASDEEWENLDPIHIPEEWLSFDADLVNKSCKESDRFIIAAACPRPFERLQFIRGTEQLYMDLMLMPDGLRKFLGQMHDFYCRLLEKWAKTDVDALSMMDDWGAQNDLLVNPELWREIFKPMYRDYIEIAHRNGKKMFMHSDGNILRILPDLIEIGLDAVNSQLFCMGLENLEQFRGKICFWGEIDRQHLLPNGTREQITRAVADVHRHLWQDGGCIAQCEFGPGANPDNVYEVFRAWDEITG